MGGPGTARSGASRTPAQVGRGEFVIPGFAKMSVVNKPATEARSGVNPFTKEPMEFGQASQQVGQGVTPEGCKDAV